MVNEGGRVVGLIVGLGEVARVPPLVGDLVVDPVDLVVGLVVGLEDVGRAVGKDVGRAVGKLIDCPSTC